MRPDQLLLLSAVPTIPADAAAALNSTAAPSRFATSAQHRQTPRIAQRDA